MVLTNDVIDSQCPARVIKTPCNMSPTGAQIDYVRVKIAGRRPHIAIKLRTSQSERTSQRLSEHYLSHHFVTVSI